jgi:hypothetical protein
MEINKNDIIMSTGTIATKTIGLIFWSLIALTAKYSPMPDNTKHTAVKKTIRTPLGITLRINGKKSKIQLSATKRPYKITNKEQILTANRCSIMKLSTLHY